MKSDYTYVSLLDPVSAVLVRDLQKGLAERFGRSVFSEQWPPHVTVSRGSLLSQEEVGSASSELAASLSETTAFSAGIDSIMSFEQDIEGTAYHSLAFRLSPSRSLDLLSSRVASVASRYQPSFDGFTAERFHISIGKYEKAAFEGIDIESVIPKGCLSEISINSVSLFYSTTNHPRPDKPFEVASVKLL